MYAFKEYNPAAPDPPARTPSKSPTPKSPQGMFSWKSLLPTVSPQAQQRFTGVLQKARPQGKPPTQESVQDSGRLGGKVPRDPEVLGQIVEMLADLMEERKRAKEGGAGGKEEVDDADDAASITATEGSASGGRREDDSPPRRRRRRHDSEGEGGDEGRRHGQHGRPTATPPDRDDDERRRHRRRPDIADIDTAALAAAMAAQSQQASGRRRYDRPEDEDDSDHGEETLTPAKHQSGRHDRPPVSADPFDDARPDGSRPSRIGDFLRPSHKTSKPPALSSTSADPPSGPSFAPSHTPQAFQWPDQEDIDADLRREGRSRMASPRDRGIRASSASRIPRGPPTTAHLPSGRRRSSTTTDSSSMQSDFSEPSEHGSGRGLDVFMPSPPKHDPGGKAPVPRSNLKPGGLDDTVEAAKELGKMVLGRTPGKGLVDEAGIVLGKDRGKGREDGNVERGEGKDAKGKSPLWNKIIGLMGACFDLVKHHNKSHRAIRNHTSSSSPEMDIINNLGSYISKQYPPLKSAFGLFQHADQEDLLHLMESLAKLHAVLQHSVLSKATWPADHKKIVAARDAGLRKAFLTAAAKAVLKYLSTTVWHLSSGMETVLLKSMQEVMTSKGNPASLLYLIAKTRKQLNGVTKERISNGEGKNSHEEAHGLLDILNELCQDLTAALASYSNLDTPQTPSQIKGNEKPTRKSDQQGDRPPQSPVDEAPLTEDDYDSQSQRSEDLDASSVDSDDTQTTIDTRPVPLSYDSRYSAQGMGEQGAAEDGREAVNVTEENEEGKRSNNAVDKRSDLMRRIELTNKGLAEWGSANEFIHSTPQPEILDDTPHPGWIPRKHHAPATMRQGDQRTAGRDLPPKRPQHEESSGRGRPTKSVHSASKRTMAGTPSASKDSSKKGSSSKGPLARTGTVAGTTAPLNLRSSRPQPIHLENIAISERPSEPVHRASDLSLSPPSPIEFDPVEALSAKSVAAPPEHSDGSSAVKADKPRSKPVNTTRTAAVAGRSLSSKTPGSGKKPSLSSSDSAGSSRQPKISKAAVSVLSKWQNLSNSTSSSPEVTSTSKNDTTPTKSSVKLTDIHPPPSPKPLTKSRAPVEPEQATKEPSFDLAKEMKELDRKLAEIQLQKQELAKRGGKSSRPRDEGGLMEAVRPGPTVIASPHKPTSQDTSYFPPLQDIQSSPVVQSSPATQSPIVITPELDRPVSQTGEVFSDVIAEASGGDLPPSAPSPLPAGVLTSADILAQGFTPPIASPLPVSLNESAQPALTEAEKRLRKQQALASPASDVPSGVVTSADVKSKLVSYKDFIGGMMPSDDPRSKWGPDTLLVNTAGEIFPYWEEADRLARGEELIDDTGRRWNKHGVLKLGNRGAYPVDLMQFKEKWGYLPDLMVFEPSPPSSRASTVPSSVGSSSSKASRATQSQEESVEAVDGEIEIADRLGGESPLDTPFPKEADEEADTSMMSLMEPPPGMEEGEEVVQVYDGGFVPMPRKLVDEPVGTPGEDEGDKNERMSRDGSYMSERSDATPDRPSEQLRPDNASAASTRPPTMRNTSAGSLTPSAAPGLRTRGWRPSPGMGTVSSRSPSIQSGLSNQPPSIASIAPIEERSPAPSQQPSVASMRSAGSARSRESRPMSLEGRRSLKPETPGTPGTPGGATSVSARRKRTGP